VCWGGPRGVMCCVRGAAPSVGSRARPCKDPPEGPTHPHTQGRQAASLTSARAAEEPGASTDTQAAEVLGSKLRQHGPGVQQQEQQQREQQQKEGVVEQEEREQQQRGGQGLLAKGKEAVKKGFGVVQTARDGSSSSSSSSSRARKEMKQAQPQERQQQQQQDRRRNEEREPAPGQVRRVCAAIRLGKVTCSQLPFRCVAQAGHN